MGFSGTAVHGAPNAANIAQVLELSLEDFAVYLYIRSRCSAELSRSPCDI